MGFNTNTKLDDDHTTNKSAEFLAEATHKRRIRNPETEPPKKKRELILNTQAKKKKRKELSSAVSGEFKNVTYGIHIDGKLIKTLDICCDGREESN